jgi:hypothetical protein
MRKLVLWIIDTALDSWERELILQGMVQPELTVETNELVDTMERMRDALIVNILRALTG